MLARAFFSLCEHVVALERTVTGKNHDTPHTTAGSGLCMCETDRYLDKWREGWPGLSVKNTMLLIGVLVRSCVKSTGIRLEQLPIEEEFRLIDCQKESEYIVHKHLVPPFPQRYDPQTFIAVSAHHRQRPTPASDGPKEHNAEEAQGWHRRRLHGCR